jgi:hypothetical protein
MAALKKVLLDTHGPIFFFFVNCKQLYRNICNTQTRKEVTILSK